MNFDIILVTRNRRSVLELSIPLMLRQSCRPRQFILVDSSDDHAAVAQTVNEIFEKWGANVPLKLIHSAPGMTLQRNIGLTHALSEVVMFPDDDSLWFPGYAEAIMRLYQRDSARVVGAIMGEEAKVPPPSGVASAATPYAMESRDKVRLWVKPLKKYGFLTFTKDPVFLAGRAKFEGKKRPEWLAEEAAEVAGPMTGFSMTFRTDIIRKHQFDEKLGRYALFEDYDASLRVMEENLILRARKAKVFHYRSPEKRTKGFEWGVLHILQRAYVVCKCTSRNSPARRNILPYSLYKCARYLAQSHSAYGRQRLKGALYAVRHLRAVVDSPPEELTRTFLATRDKCLSAATAHA